MADMHFLPYLRTGLASNINEQAVDGMATGAPATADVTISVTADLAAGGTESSGIDTRRVQLYGPGSITAIDEAQIIRRYPEPGAADPELNYFCLTEFRDPDFPWRYTPARPDGADRLQPWLALVVVAVDQCEIVSGAGLDVLTVAGNLLPPVADTWAWAHVQVDSTAPSIDPVAEYAARPSAFRSRLLCPTRLVRDTRYVACIVPTFEAGRLAGLGTPNVAATGAAWGATSDLVELPIYSSWRFRTSEPGDFESLVRRLTPRELPAEVGVRDLDISAPGSGVPAIDDAVVSFQGALVSPAAEPIAWTDAQRVPIQNGLLQVLRDNVPFEDDPDDPDEYDPLVHDPVVRPSLYGAIQSGESALAPGPIVRDDDDKALADRVRPLDGRPERTGPGFGRQADRIEAAARRDRTPPVRWMDELNLDPTTRTVGGIGSAVVRNDQERLMDAAWEAARGINDVNRRLNAAATAVAAATKLEQRVSGLPQARLVQFLGPSLARHSTGSGTRLAQLRSSDLPNVTVASAYRRVVRPGGLVSRRLALADAGTAVNLRLQRAPIGPIAQHRRTAIPAGCDAVIPTPADPSPGPMQLIEPSIARYIDTKNLGEYNTPGRLGKANPNVHDFRRPVPPGRGGRIVSDYSADRVVRELNQPLRRRGPLRPRTVPGATDSLLSATRGLLDTVQPINNRLRSAITAPAGIPTDSFPRKMWATPSFPHPLYERVKALGLEYLVPGVGLIPDETVGLLEANDRYLESVMVAANHELSREFLWREYPAQLHRTWFQQFWNAPKVDIAPIADWRPRAALGSQDGSDEADLVLVIKGVFPRRYPDVQIWAQRGAWMLDETRDRWERNLQPGGARRYPVMAGELQPGVVFYGFQLTEEDAVGGSLDPDDRETDAGDPGWFFVLQEQPKGIRFGLDKPTRAKGEIVGHGEAPTTEWADLSWGHVADRAEDDPPIAVDFAATPWLKGISLPSVPDSLEVTDEWAANSAAQARITLQRPVQLKVHASAMLPDREEQRA